MSPDEEPITDVMDGNTAVAHVAYRVNDGCAIYPITPASPMAELADEWAAGGLTNLFGRVPFVAELQSEAGAAGAVHGALQSGALTTTFTASQGLLLMLPNMYKIAGELTSTVFHVAARAVATQALSIFGDHSDVMAARATGFALLSSASVQEAHDAALIAQAATLASRIPFLHFFDGFRTSHQIDKIRVLSQRQLRAMIDPQLVRAHRSRGLSPEHPVLRGTSHDPDTFFQAREAVNPYYARTPQAVEEILARFAALTGRRYRLFEFDGAQDAERVIVIMGSGAETVRAVAQRLRSQGEKVGVLQVRLYRPFSARHFLSALPVCCRAVAVLERTKEPGASGEPLYLDVLATLAEALARGERSSLPRVVGGRYGLGSKNFSPAQALAVFHELKKADPRHGFTVGIEDDVCHTSLEVDRAFTLEPEGTVRALFFGLGSDGTVGANKNSAKIIARDAGRFAQAYFVYDSHKAGARTVSHLRFGPRPIHAPYLIESASFIACHNPVFLERIDVLREAAEGATFLLNTPHGPGEVWSHLPRRLQQRIIERHLHLYVIDASRVAREAGLGAHVNTVLQACFFAISGVLAREEAIGRIKQAIEHSYRGQGQEVVRGNFVAVDRTLAELFEVPIPAAAAGPAEVAPLVPADAPRFVREVTAELMAGRGDELKVSQLPADGTYPTGTAVFEKRNVSDIVAAWIPERCVQCGECGFVCPHSAIRAKYFEEARLAAAPAGFRSVTVNVRGFPSVRFALQFYPEDCTGCGLCIEACPAGADAGASSDDAMADEAAKAIRLTAKAPLLAAERDHIAFFESLAVNERSRVDFANVRGVQFLQALFEFSGACAGCGETPYLKLLSQLFGDRAQIANATGCSSIYGGNLPVTPWTKGPDGRGPAWANSLFEDNAEFGLGFRLAADQQLEQASALLRELAPVLGEPLVRSILEAPQMRESQLRAQRERVRALKGALERLQEERARELLSLADQFVRRSIWIVGGDGWAYDIGSAGLDHVLASGRDLNILVLDTEVYSNTGGQASKATPLGAVARFAAAGKRTARRDLALQAIAYGNVYVAQVAMGANPQQTLLAFREAEAYPGTSLILAYCHCIAHGFDLRFGLRQQRLAVASGYWPLFRFNPAMRTVGERPFRLDSRRPAIPFKDYAYRELRYRKLAGTDPRAAAELLAQAQQVVLEKYRGYEELATRAGESFHPAQAASARAGRMI